MRAGTTNVSLTLSDGFTPRDILRISRLARELRLTNQILSTDLDTVSVVDTGPAPAWTSLDGDHVSFAAKRMPRLDRRVDVAVWLGTNAHELGHVLFSPRKGSPLMQRIIEGEQLMLKGITQLHNIVEDQREERLMLARFAPWRSYLTAALGFHLKADDMSAWLLMAGRTWLPDKVRAEAQARFVMAWGRATADEVEGLIGDYQRLVDPGDSEADEAWAVLERLHALFEGHMPTLPPTCTVMEGGEPDTGEAGEGAPAAADEAGDEGGTGSSGEDGDGDDGMGDAEGDDADGGSGEAGGAGTQPGKGGGDIGKQLRNAAKRQIDTADDESADDLDAIIDAMRYGRPGDEAEGDEPIGRLDVATDEARRLHREVGDALLDLKDLSEPGWIKRVDSGRLSPKRLASGADPDTLFDRYEPGQMDASELDVMLLLDVSGTMAGSTHPLAEATWAIRHAVDDLEGECTVLTWDSGPHRVLAKAGERPDERMFVPSALGGTVPTSALREAYGRLADSQARNRLMVIITDGDWGGDVRQAHAVIEAMRDEGIITVCALLGHRVRAGEFHSCEYGGHIAEPLELARLFRRVAAERIGAWRS